MSKKLDKFLNFALPVAMVMMLVANIDYALINQMHVNTWLAILASTPFAIVGIIILTATGDEDMQ